MRAPGDQSAKLAAYTAQQLQLSAHKALLAGKNEAFDQKVFLAQTKANAMLAKPSSGVSSTTALSAEAQAQQGLKLVAGGNPN